MIRRKQNTALASNSMLLLVAKALANQRAHCEHVSPPASGSLFSLHCAVLPAVTAVCSVNMLSFVSVSPPLPLLIIMILLLYRSVTLLWGELIWGLSFLGGLIWGLYIQRETGSGWFVSILGSDEGSYMYYLWLNYHYLGPVLYKCLGHKEKMSTTT